MRRFALALTAALLALHPAASGQSPSGASGYQVVHGWPVLLDGFVLGPAAGVAVDSKGHVWVFHRGERFWQEPLPTDTIKNPTVIEFDGKSGKVLRLWGGGLFAMPHGLTIDAEDNLWLTDVALHQVFKFSREGKLLLSVGERGIPGTDATHFNRPTDIAVLPDGSFYVADGYRNTRVAKFSADGRFEFQWGKPGNGPGEFNTPHGIVVDRAGVIYVADRENDRVQVFSSKGRFLRQWQTPAMGRPYGITLLPGAVTAVVDGGEQPEVPPDRSGVSILQADGNVAEHFGRFGNQDGQFRMGHDIASDTQGNLYVVDITGQRVQKFVRTP
jgi:peptidylamidoglycolate lyase